MIDFIIFNKWISTYEPGSNPNPDLRWEKKKEFNVGLDMSVLGNRLNVTVDYYNRRTRAAETPDAAARAESKTPLEHFAAFYEAQNGQSLSDEQAACCQSLIEDIWKEDEA